MTFPLNPETSSGSLISNLPTGYLRLSNPSNLPSILSAIEKLSELTGLCPGSEAQLTRAIGAIGGQKLSGEDGKACATFREFLRAQTKCSPGSRPLDLETCLADFSSSQLPPFSELIDKIDNCIKSTGLTGGDLDRWVRVLRRYYRIDGDLRDQVRFVDFCETVHATLSLVQSRQTTEHFNKRVDDEVLKQTQSLTKILGVSLRDRLKTLLNIEGLPTVETKLRHLQVVCNALLREEYLLQRIASLFETLRVEFHLNDTAQLSPEIIAANYKPGSSKLLFLDNNLNLLSFYILIDGLATKASMMRKKMPDVVKPERGLLDIIHQPAIFAKYNEILKFIERVEREHLGQPDEYSIKTMARFAKKNIAELKARWHIENFQIYFRDLQLKVTTSSALPFPQSEKPIAPIFTSISEFTGVVINRERGDTDLEQCLHFYVKIASIYLQHHLKQSVIYKSAFTQLNAIINEHSTDKKRALLKYKRVDVDIAHLQGILPDQIGSFSIDFSDKGALQKTASPQAESKERSVTVDLPSKSTDRASEIGKSPAGARENRGAALSPATSSRQSAITSPKLPTTAKKTSRLLDLPTAAPFSYKYEKSVARWFEATLPLDKKLFAKYATSSVEYQKRMIDAHAFTRLADFFCAQSFRYRDRGALCHVLPAEMIVGTKCQRGYIIWATDENGHCFHRFFHIDQSKSVYEKYVRKTFTEADFPELNVARESRGPRSTAQLKPQSEVDRDVVVEFDELLRIVSLGEVGKELLLRIFIG